MGHYCRACDRTLPNERFTGRGHAGHICKKCQRTRREQRKHAQALDNPGGHLQTSQVGDASLEVTTEPCHADPVTTEVTVLLSQVDAVVPHRLYSEAVRELAEDGLLGCGREDETSLDEEER